MNDTYLFIYSAIYRNRSVTRAAEELHMTEAGVSRVLKSLETEYNSVFFERKRKSMLPTKAGDLFFQSAEKIISEMDSLRHSLNPQISPTERIEIGCSAYFSDTVLSQMLDVLTCDDYHITASASPALDAFSKEQVLDIVLSFSQMDARYYKNIFLGTDRLFAMTGTKNPVPSDVTPEQLAKYNCYAPSQIVMSPQLFNDFFKSLGITPRIALESSSLYFIIKSLRQTQGYALLGERYLLTETFDKVLIPLPLQGHSLKRDMYLSIKRELITAAPVQHFVDRVLSILPEQTRA